MTYTEERLQSETRTCKEKRTYGMNRTHNWDQTYNEERIHNDKHYYLTLVENIIFAPEAKSQVIKFSANSSLQHIINQPTKMNTSEDEDEIP
jgi:hypothetical protein